VEGLAFDHVIASPARRVEGTIAGVEAGCGRALSPVWDRRVYLAPAVLLLDLLRATAGAERVLVVGHNPGLHELALLLLANADPRRGELAAGYPTGALAELRFAEAAPGTAALARFVRP